ncbi:prolyl hydroxylase family protein [Brevundimonas lenta]|uniref:Prolyl 4-hydroxylase n=1 Tax=Brevundimonas lenta TaxID=424796 RepID=A0A7W6NPJ2_9CAUL|nr:2OG-Fe(II) oxygenase [Brevundimonas lenta]MBB4082594.1 prolyl 4-hydroxylase [Brevundimonas lenta]
MDRVETGQRVRERLLAAPNVQHVPVEEVDLFILRDFLDADQCAALIELIDVNRKRSRLFGDHPDPEFRTSETCNLDPAEAVVIEAEAGFHRLIGLAPEYGERLQGQRYEAGQQFKPHHDYLRTSEPYWPRQQAIGGQRTWTAMVFLDAPEKGGATYFPLLDLTLPPRRGNLIVWNNLDAAGEPNRMTLHQGMPVEAGVKHIVTKWWRERPWGLSPDVSGRA